jgi:DNA-binding transcriptional LysR family regulator
VDIHQLRTFVAVAREGSITRASERLHLSQPAVSAHVKALEDALGLALFARSARGMTLTPGGERLLAKAEDALAAHRELLDEASKLRGRPASRLRIGAGASASHEAVGRLVTAVAERHHEIEIAIQHGTSRDILAGLRAGTLDAGFYNEAGEAALDLATLEVSRFAIHVAAAPGLAPARTPVDWSALAGFGWIYPPSSACCGRAAERLFEAHRIRPKRVVEVDREPMVRTLIAAGVGVGLLHSETAKAAEARGEVELLFEVPSKVRVLFAHLASRADDPALGAARSILDPGSRSG